MLTERHRKSWVGWAFVECSHSASGGGYRPPSRAAVRLIQQFFHDNAPGEQARKVFVPMLVFLPKRPRHKISRLQFRSRS
jgi:hypothetical protein